MSMYTIRNLEGVKVENQLYIEDSADFTRTELEGMIDFTGGAGVIVIDSTISAPFSFGIQDENLKNILSINGTTGRIAIHEALQNPNSNLTLKLQDTAYGENNAFELTTDNEVWATSFVWVTDTRMILGNGWDAGDQAFAIEIDTTGVKLWHDEEILTESITLAAGILGLRMNSDNLFVYQNDPTDSAQWQDRAVPDKAYVDTKRPYELYVATIRQNLGDSPIATVFENTLGGVPIWFGGANNGLPGMYELTLIGAFPASRTFIQISGGRTPGNNPDFASIDSIIINYELDWDQSGSGDTIQFMSYNEAGSQVDDTMLDVSIEIRVYPAPS